MAPLQSPFQLGRLLPSTRSALDSNDPLARSTPYALHAQAAPAAARSSPIKQLNEVNSTVIDKGGKVAGIIQGYEGTLSRSNKDQSTYALPLPQPHTPAPTPVYSRYHTVTTGSPTSASTAAGTTTVPASVFQSRRNPPGSPRRTAPPAATPSSVVYSRDDMESKRVPSRVDPGGLDKENARVNNGVSGAKMTSPIKLTVPAPLYSPVKTDQLPAPRPTHRTTPSSSSNFIEDIPPTPPARPGMSSPRKLKVDSPVILDSSRGPSKADKRGDRKRAKTLESGSRPYIAKVDNSMTDASDAGESLDLTETQQEMEIRVEQEFEVMLVSNFSNALHVALAMVLI